MFRIASRLRSTAMVLVAASALPAIAPQAMAQQQFDRLVSFGDSYADPNINVLPLIFGNTRRIPSQGRSVEELEANPSVPYVAYPYWLQAYLGLANEDMTSYAIAGSTTDPQNVVGIPYSLPFQLQRSAGEVYGENDLITLSVGGNDGRRDSQTYGAGFTPEIATNLAVGVADRASAAVQTFAGQGAGTIVALSFSDLALLPELAASPRPSSLTVYGQTLYTGMQENLVATAQGGTRIFLMDLSLVGARIRDNLAAYGFTSFEWNGNAYESVFRPDDLHLTTHGFQIVAQYMMNALQSPYAAAESPALAQSATQSFANSLFNRLDTNRLDVPVTPYSVYMIGSLGKADQQDVDGKGGGVTIGAEMQFNPQWLGGLAVNYSSFSSDGGLSDIDDKAFQLAAYGSYKANGWFGDALLGYGHHDLDLNRPGVLDPLSGDTDANSFTAALRGGYLFDLGAVRAGPLLGLRHTSTRVDAYDEDGDPGLEMLVERQRLNSTTSDVGIEAHAAVPLGQRSIDAFASVAWRHEFADGSRTLTTRLAQSPLLPIGTDIRNFNRRDYGVVAAGLSMDLSESVSATVSGTSTFARGGGDSFQVDAGIGIGF